MVKYCGDINSSSMVIGAMKIEKKQRKNFKKINTNTNTRRVVLKTTDFRLRCQQQIRFLLINKTKQKITSAFFFRFYKCHTNSIVLNN